jgi:hypothetical protein
MGTNFASFAEMQKASGVEGFSSSDYIFYVLRELNVASDFMRAFVELLTPTIVKEDGLALIETVGAVEKYRKYRREGQSPERAQYWANLTLISGVFEAVDETLDAKIAALVANCWNAALRESQEMRQTVRIVADESDGIFLALGETTAP